MTQRNIGVAIGLPEPYASELQGWRDRLGDPNAGSIPAHVTLLPPTAVREDSLPAIQEHLRGVAESTEPFLVHLRGSATFRPVSPVVFVPLVQGVTELERLERAVRHGPLARRPSFPYYPHVTVAHEIADPLLDRAFEQLASYDAQFVVCRFSLFERGPDAVWCPQQDFPLGAAGCGAARAG